MYQQADHAVAVYVAIVPSWRGRLRSSLERAGPCHAEPAAATKAQRGTVMMGRPFQSAFGLFTGVLAQTN